ncbi:MAG: hypothetical protein ACYDHH_14180 [Solirubrobacteraceae bacterium]
MTTAGATLLRDRTTTRMPAAWTGCANARLTQHPFAAFNRNGAVYKDNAESFSTNEPAVDLTASSPLAFAWQSTTHGGLS